MSPTKAALHDPIVPAPAVDDFVMVRAMAFTNQVQRTMTRDVLRDEDLPLLEWRLLFWVARFGRCPLAHISRMTSIDPAHGSRALAALERKGLITRCDDPQNQRLLHLVNAAAQTDLDAPDTANVRAPEPKGEVQTTHAP